MPMSLSDKQAKMTTVSELVMLAGQKYSQAASGTITIVPPTTFPTSPEALAIDAAEKAEEMADLAAYGDRYLAKAAEIIALMTAP